MVSDCNCGTTTPGVTAIQVSGGATISVKPDERTYNHNAAAVDAGGNPVTGATLTYCSDNMAVVNVSGGTIMPSGIGTATLTICNGSVQTTITVNVTL
jgi:hypothetical protein